MNILSRMCNAGRGDIVGNLARQNIPLWSWCNSKPSLPGLIHPSFHPRTEEIPAHFLPPFNTTLAKITIRLIKFIFAALPLRNFAIKIEFALILYLIKTLFAKFMFVSRCLIVNLTLPFPSWQTVRGCCFTSQPIFGQNPWLTGTSGEAETLCKRHICNTETICSFCLRHEIAPISLLLGFFPFPWYRKE